jgi:hypothetical protein
VSLPVDDATLQLLDAAARLHQRASSGAASLGLVAATLAELADVLGTKRAYVALDDPVLGRQVFTSARLPIGDDDEPGFDGPPRLVTVPPVELDQVAEHALVVAVGHAVACATAPVELATRATPVPDVTLPARRLGDVAREAAARAVRHGWGFTLVLCSLAPDGERPPADVIDGLRHRLREGDTVVPVDNHRCALVLPATAPDQVQQVVARATEGAGTVCFGVVTCPGDASDPDELVALCVARLHERERALASS